MKNPDSEKAAEEIQKMINYIFRKKDLLREALTHSSYANESGLPYHNERMEFLGDAVLELTVSDLLYDRYKELDEGQLTRIRSQIVCEKKLYEWALAVGLHRAVRLGRSLIKKGPTPAIAADTAESLFGAVFLDGGYSAALSLAKAYLEFHRDELSPDRQDTKTLLQETLQAMGRGVPYYRTVERTGPDHSLKFKVEVTIGDELLAEAWGNTIKEAEFEAAGAALKKMQG
ncbi:MAG TPA: ribonuclease III [Synergistaceae bacterium]|mgnify:CR=1 FL=1|jgi:ribonuclease-3|nr:ribonuclease III [Synergistaceae bacterium]